MSNILFLLLLIYIKFTNCFNDYDDYILENYHIYEPAPIQKRNMILKSSFCQYFNFLPICSETILYRPDKSRNVPSNKLQLSQQLLHKMTESNRKRRLAHFKWFNSPNNKKSQFNSFKRALHQSKRRYKCPTSRKYRRTHKNKQSPFLKHGKHKRQNDETEEICTKFLHQINNNLQNIYNNNTLIQWNYESNITDYNKNIAIIADEIFARELKENWNNAQDFNKKHECTQLNGSISRQFKILSKLGDTALPSADYMELQTVLRDMESIFSTATVPDYKIKNKTLQLEPDITCLMASNKNQNELKYIWEAWRNVTGLKMKDLYPRYVTLVNKAATLNGYVSAAELWLSVYDDEHIEQKIENIWKQIQPLYLQIHAYIRQKLKNQYENIESAGPIPAHLIGNIFGQTWINLYNLTAPYPKYNLPDFTAQLQSQGYTPKMMFKEAEHFFKSLNLSAMTKEFWENSIIEQRKDVKMVCHASAWDMYDRKDFRIKMCTQVTYEDFIIIHHEMGHVEYYMQYKNLPVVFREGANPGFHEAIGDTIALSVSTPAHIRSLGFECNDLEKNATEKDMNFLFLMALQKIMFLPYALVVDMWRWDVFRGKITKNEYNTHWWNLKRKYQGIIPPNNRSKEFFDPGAKYHIAAGVPYIRYFISFVIQFQFHEALCKEAGRLNNEHPLHTCDIYQSCEAGKLLKKMLALGQSKPWPKVMHLLTKNDNMDANSLLLYFKPLEIWLRYENEKRNNKIGWD